VLAKHLINLISAVSIEISDANEKEERGWSLSSVYSFMNVSKLWVVAGYRSMDNSFPMT
jgi:hypothetical protein